VGEKNQMKRNLKKIQQMERYIAGMNYGQLNRGRPLRAGLLSQSLAVF
jgi:hypothetical protein